MAKKFKPNLAEKLSPMSMSNYTTEKRKKKHPLDGRILLRTVSLRKVNIG